MILDDRVQECIFGTEQKQPGSIDRSLLETQSRLTSKLPHIAGPHLTIMMIGPIANTLERRINEIVGSETGVLPLVKKRLLDGSDSLRMVALGARSRVASHDDRARVLQSNKSRLLEAHAGLMERQFGDLVVDQQTQRMITDVVNDLAVIQNEERQIKDALGREVAELGQQLETAVQFLQAHGAWRWPQREIDQMNYWESKHNDFVVLSPFFIFFLEKLGFFDTQFGKQLLRDIRPGQSWWKLPNSNSDEIYRVIDRLFDINFRQFPKPFTGLRNYWSVVKSAPGSSMKVALEVGKDFAKTPTSAAGRLILVVGVAVEAGTEFVEEFNDKKNTGASDTEAIVHASVDSASAVVGTLAGMKVGAIGGATIGTLICPGIGTAIGGFIGGALGGWAGSEAGQWLTDNDIVENGIGSALNIAESSIGSALKWMSGR